MLHSLNHSVACAVLQMGPLAKAAEAHCTAPRPLAIEALIADHEAPAFRPLIITAAEVHCALDVCTTIEDAVDDAAYESFHPDQRDAESCAYGSHHEQDGSKQLTFVQVYGMLHSQNHSVAYAVLQMRPLAKAAEAHCTVLRPFITTVGS